MCVDYFLKCKTIGIIANNSGTITANAFPKNLIAGVNFELVAPSD